MISAAIGNSRTIPASCAPSSSRPLREGITTETPAGAPDPLTADLLTAGPLAGAPNLRAARGRSHPAARAAACQSAN
jgi:hypothetical protein